MTEEALEAVGVLDEVAFGKGYGEENDWCMRAIKAGFVNLLAEDVFVYHAGQISFGLDEGGEYDQGQAALLAKHPTTRPWSASSWPPIPAGRPGHGSICTGWPDTSGAERSCS